jgi:hypothetical protein
MTARPPSTDLPRWATATGALITEPNAGKKDTGWSESAPGVGEDPPLDYFNWLQRRTYDFLKWLADQVVTTDEEQTITANKIFAPTALGSTALVGIGTTNGSTAAGVGIAAEGNADRAALFLVPQAQPTNFATLDGDIYVDSGTKKLRARINGVWKTMVVLDDAQTFTAPQTVTPNTGGNAITATGGPAGGVGLLGTGTSNRSGVAGTGHGTASGVIGTGGATDGVGVRGDAGGANGTGVLGNAAGTGAGVSGVSVGTGPAVVGDATGGTGNGATFTASVGIAMKARSTGAGDALQSDASAGTGCGGVFTGNTTRGALRIFPTAYAAGYPSNPQIGDICLLQASTPTNYNLYMYMGAVQMWVLLS